MVEPNANLLLLSVVHSETGRLLAVDKIAGPPGEKGLSQTALDQALARLDSALNDDLWRRGESDDELRNNKSIASHIQRLLCVIDAGDPVFETVTKELETFSSGGAHSQAAVIGAHALALGLKARLQFRRRDCERENAKSLRLAQQAVATLKTEAGLADAEDQIRLLRSEPWTSRASRASILSCGMPSALRSG